MSEAFELADETASLGGLVGALFEVVTTELLVVDVGGEHPPDADEHRVGDGEDGFASLRFPNRRENRLNCAAR